METLVMPMNYVELQEDEMMYLDGGGIPRWTLSFAIDALLLATPVGLSAAPLKFLGKEAAASLVKRIAPQVAGIAGWALRQVLGGAINLSVGTMTNLIIRNATSFTSIGGMIAFIGDWADGNLNGWIG